MDVHSALPAPHAALLRDDGVIALVDASRVSRKVRRRHRTGRHHVRVLPRPRLCLIVFAPRALAVRRCHAADTLDAHRRARAQTLSTLRCFSGGERCPRREQSARSCARRGATAHELSRRSGGFDSAARCSGPAGYKYRSCPYKYLYNPALLSDH